MKFQLRMLCPLGGKGTGFIAAGLIIGSLAFMFALAFSLVGEMEHPLLMSLALFAAIYAVFMFLGYCSAYRPNKGEKKKIASAEPLDWKTAEESDIDGLKERYKVKWYIHISVLAVALYVFFDYMQRDEKIVFSLITALVLIAADAVMMILEIMRCRFWKREYLLTESAEVIIDDVYSVKQRQRYSVDYVNYMVVYLPEGKFVFKQYDNSYPCEKVHIIRRGEKYTFVQAR